MGFRVWGSEFGVQGLGFRVWGSGFGVQGLGFRVWGSGSTSYVAVIIATNTVFIRISLSGRQANDTAAGKWVCTPPWHKAGPLSQLADQADPDQWVVKKQLFSSSGSHMKRELI